MTNGVTRRTIIGGALATGGLILSGASATDAFAVGRAPKPTSKLALDGVWGVKSRAAFDYVVNTGKVSTAKVTGDSDTAMKSLSKTEVIALQKYLNHEFANWTEYYDGVVYGHKFMNRLVEDGVWGAATSNAMTNYFGYLGNVQFRYYSMDLDIGQWWTPTVEYIQYWINCAAFRTKLAVSGVSGARVPYLP